MENNKVDLDGLNPIPESVRPIRPLSYILIMWSTAIIVQVMAIGTFLLQDGLSLFQVVIVGVISAVLVAFFAAFNAFPGLKDGIPFIIQLRSSFGYKGAKLAYIFRIVPAICWYGIGTWIGAVSIQTILTMLFDAPDMKFLYFILLTIFQIILSYKGITSIKWFDAVVASAIFVMLAYFLTTVILSGNVDFSGYTNNSGSWGLLFWGGVSAATANWATVMLNNSDMMRHVKPANGKTNFLVNFIGIVPPWLAMVFSGLLIFVATGLDDPIAGLMSLSPNPTFGVILLIFIVLAQVTSNLTTSILPAALAFQDLFKVKWGTGVIIAGVLSCITAPWVLFTSDWFFTFQNIYSSFLGPMLGILIADYWVLQKGKLNLSYLYNEDTEAYKFFKGFSPAACLSLFIAASISFWQLDIAWLVGLPAGFMLYIFFKKIGLEKKFEKTASSSHHIKEAAVPNRPSI